MLTCTPANAPSPGHAANCLCHSPEIQGLNRRLSAGLSRRGFVGALALTLASPRLADAQTPARPILFRNVRVFDGSSSTLRDGQNVLVEGNLIKAIAAGGPAAPDGARVIDGGGRVLMPGLIDAHWHALFAALPLPVLLTAEIPFIHLAAANEAQRTLLRGFTTVRDLGGPAFALKKAIDQGMAPGPRIYPSGAMITASGGHGDLRPLSDIPSDGKPTVSEQTGRSIVTDGPTPSASAPASSCCRAPRRSSWWAAAASRRRAARSTRPASPRPSCVPASRRRATGRPTSPCTPIRRSPSGGRSTPAPPVSSTAI